MDTKVNRLERRKAKAQARNTKPDPIIAIHEAGHAVGRVLTADAMGYAPDEAISFIEFHISGSNPIATSADKKMSLFSQATTYGPMFSKDISDRLSSQIEALGAPPDRKTLAPMIAALRDEGIDLGGWLKARAFIAIMGPMAEARYRNVPFNDMWQSYECEDDFRAVVSDCMLAGQEDNSAVTALMNEQTLAAQDAISKDKVWRAVTVLADSLPSVGRMSGKRAAAIITREINAKGISAAGPGAPCVR